MSDENDSILLTKENATIKMRNNPKAAGFHVQGQKQKRRQTE